MMTDREKLIDLLEGAESAIYWNSEDKSFVEKIADHLIANGVTFATDNNVGDKMSPAAYKMKATDAEAEIFDIHIPCRKCGKLIPAGVNYCLHCRLRSLNDTTFTALVAKTMPKSDIIRSMSDEEMAMMLMKAHDGELRIPFCKNLDECYDYLDHYDGLPEEKCMRCMLEWLQQPVEVE